MAGKGSTVAGGFSAALPAAAHLPSADGFGQLQPRRCATAGARRDTGFVQQQDIDSREAMMNDLQQFFRVQIRQPAIEQEQLAFAAFQFA